MQVLILEGVWVRRRMPDLGLDRAWGPHDTRGRSGRLGGTDLSKWYDVRRPLQLASCLGAEVTVLCPGHWPSLWILAVRRILACGMKPSLSFSLVDLIGLCRIPFGLRENLESEGIVSLFPFRC